MTAIGIALIAIGLVLWIIAARLDKWQALENDRFVAVLLLIVVGMGCVVGGVVLLWAIWIEGATVVAGCCGAPA